MRMLVLLGIIAAVCFSARAAELTTVERLEQKLAAHQAAHVSRSDSASKSKADEDAELLRRLDQDDELVPQIVGMELSDRLTRATLERFISEYKLGMHMQQALEELADRFALLEAPASEFPKLPEPGADAQRRMMVAARAYVFQVLSHLPNFFATRTTSRFDDTPPTAVADGSRAKTGLRLVGSSKREITFRDGNEVVDPMKSADAPTFREPGMESWGEFGPEPAIVLFDLSNKPITFRHWEKSASGLAAVYSYIVPKSNSHYEVNYRCLTNKAFHDNPGYHGTLAIDPASGAILRITLEADWQPSDPISHVASVVEYGPVVIGDRRSICPLRSLAFMVEEANVCTRLIRNRKLTRPVKMLNRTTFTNYHRLGSTAKIIVDKADESAPSSNTPVPPGIDTAKDPAAAQNKSGKDKHD